MDEYSAQVPNSKGQDLTDFFARHKRSRADLEEILEQAHTPDLEAAEAAIAEVKEGPGRFWLESSDGRKSFRPALLADEILREVELLTDRESKVTYRWTGQHYKQVHFEDLQRIAKKKMGNLSTTARVNDAINQVKFDSYLPEDETMNLARAWPDEEQGDKHVLLCVNNGMLDLDTGRLLPHDRKYRAVFKFPWDFDPKGTGACPRFNKFLSETVQIRRVIGEVQEFAGYTLWPYNAYEKVLFLQGPGSDGKSVLIKVLQAMVGDDNCASVDLADLESEFYRAMLHNKSLNAFAEIDAHLPSSKYLKAIATGDSLMAAYKFQDGFTFAPFCKLIFSGQDFPNSPDKSFAFYRRFLPIPFRRQFIGSAADPYLIDKLLAELPAIFHWALVGLYYLRRRGYFRLSADTEAVQREHKYQSNPVLQFLDECAVAGEGYSVARNELYEAYKTWTKDAGHYTKNKAQFGKALKLALADFAPSVSEARPTTPTGRQYTWCGLDLRKE
jgi:putative DNA primase/helicase